MAREIVSIDQLTERLKAALRANRGCEGCSFRDKVTWRPPDDIGCNWSPPQGLALGDDCPEDCRRHMQEIIDHARMRFNVASFVVRALRGNLRGFPVSPGEKLTPVEVKPDESFETLEAALDHAKGLLATCKLEIAGPEGLHWEHDRVRNEVNAPLK